MAAAFSETDMQSTSIYGIRSPLLSIYLYSEPPPALPTAEQQ